MKIEDGGCGRHDCGASTGIHDPCTSSLSGMTFGRGRLDSYGYFDEPCEKCARAFEQKYPEAYPCWPFPPEYFMKHTSTFEHSVECDDRYSTSPNDCNGVGCHCKCHTEA